MPNTKNPDARLLSALPYLTPGGTVADIGTDHAYLPIELCRRGICRRAVACDINRGPLESARANIAAAGFSDRIDTLLTDGLHGVEQWHPHSVRSPLDPGRADRSGSAAHEPRRGSAAVPVGERLFGDGGDALPCRPDLSDAVRKVHRRPGAV